MKSTTIIVAILNFFFFFSPSLSVRHAPSYAVLQYGIVLVLYTIVRFCATPAVLSCHVTCTILLFFFLVCFDVRFVCGLVFLSARGLVSVGGEQVASLLRENAGAKTEAGLKVGDLQQRLSAAQDELTREREIITERKVHTYICII